MKFSIITLGCTLNRGESQRMINILKNKFEFTENPDESDILIINTCTVKTPSETKLFKLLKKYSNKKIILAGCLVQHKPELFKNYPLVGIYQIDRVDEVVENYLNGKILQLLEVKKINKLSIRSFDNYPIKIIPIQEGCLWNCTYCATKLARSLYQSFPPEDIYREIRDAKINGLKIIYLTGTDLAAYGFDIGTNLAKLLKGIRDIDGDFYIRVGMANPGILNKFFDELLDAYEDDRIFKFFHIPVQSGSNKVLKDMKRLYTVEEFYELVEKIRRKYPKATIATDIIVGYPTETEEDFKLTLQMIEELKFDIINISRFWPRDKTPAYNLKQLRGTEVKRRSRIVKQLFNKVALERNKEWINEITECIVESKGKGNSWICRDINYKQIVVKSNENLLGKKLLVKIEEATPVDLRGRILKIKN